MLVPRDPPDKTGLVEGCGRIELRVKVFISGLCFVRYFSKTLMIQSESVVIFFCRCVTVGLPVTDQNDFTHAALLAWGGA